MLGYYSFGLVTLCLLVGLKNLTDTGMAATPWLLMPMWFFFLLDFKKRNGYLKTGLMVYSMALSLIMVIAGMLSVKKLADLWFVFVLSPLPVFFLLKGTGKNTKKVAETKESADEKIDTSRREFLRTAAGAGLATLIMFLLSKRKAVNAAFFGGGSGGGTMAVKDSSGTKIDPAQRQPLDGYAISDMDTTGPTRYYGFLNKLGGWYIMREDTANNTFTYFKGAGDYNTGWSDRTTSGNYANFHTTFSN